MKSEDIDPAVTLSLKDAFDQLFTELHKKLFTELYEIKADIKQVKIYANAAAQIMFADDPEFERRVRESVEIFTRIVDAGTEKENTK